MIVLLLIALMLPLTASQTLKKISPKLTDLINKQSLNFSLSFHFSNKLGGFCQIFLFLFFKPPRNNRKFHSSVCIIWLLWTDRIWHL